MFPYYFICFDQVDTDELALNVYERHTNVNLPDEVRGVFWMAGNTFPELLMTLEQGPFRKGEKSVTLMLGETYGWSYNVNAAGWALYFGVTLSRTFLHAGTIVFEFDAEWIYATIWLKIYGVKVQKWYVEREQSDTDGSTWIRGKFDDAGMKLPIYTLKKVINHNGTKLAAFAQMLDAGRDSMPVQDIPNIIYMNGSMDPSPALAKTYRQIVAVPPEVLAILVGLIMLIAYGACCACCISQSQIYTQWAATQSHEYNGIA